MNTKSEISISTVWDIFKVEIVPEAPRGGGLISKSRWGEGWKEGGSFFFSFLRGEQKGEGQLSFYFIFRGGEYAGRYVCSQCNLSLLAENRKP